ncbi:MAG: DUF4910 domain-containing protein [Anaerolineae bacterium]|nr:DUF4910 domain-containing protein [Anaerolineae bacterium]
MFLGILDQVASEFSGERAAKLVQAIHEHDRWSTFSHYEASGSYIAARMREYGLSDIELLRIPADGETRFGDWVVPLAWDVAEAFLELVEPEGEARLLANYREEPASLAMWSAPTPPEGVEAEVVLLADGRHEEDYSGVDVRGKVVFSSQPASAVRAVAIQQGAIGVITDYPACSDDALAEGVAWINAWTDDHGWGFLKKDLPAFGFSLTREKGEYLRRLLREGRSVKVRALVRSWLYEGSFPLVTGVIPGESEKEILVFAHGDEYGAEDNASGCAVSLEAARALTKLIQEGKLSRPRRRIRFIISWECYGSMFWCVQRILPTKNVVAGLCLDGMGGKRALTGGQPKVVLNPHCQASFTDWLAFQVAGACFPKESKLTVPWSTGTDHMIFEDPFWDIPMPLFTEYPSRFHHTSLDRMDKIDPGGLGKAGAFAATYLYFLAVAGEEEISWLARGTRQSWEERIWEVVRESEPAASVDEKELSDHWQRAKGRAAYFAERGRRAVLSVRKLDPKVALEGELERLNEAERSALARLDEKFTAWAHSRGWAPESSEQAESEGGLVPVRLVPGPLTLCTLPLEAQKDFKRIAKGQNPMWSAELILALYWADGRRTVAEIQRLLELELGKVTVDLEKYFVFLHEHGYIDWA